MTNHAAKHRKHLIAILVLLLIVGFAIVKWHAHSSTSKPTATNSSGTSQLIDVSVRLPIPAVDTAFSHAYLCLQRGIYEKHGLRVTLEPGTAELNPVKMVSSGKDAFGILGGPELLVAARSRGAPLVAVALLHRDSNFVVIITKKASGISRIEQLEGKDLGVFVGHISTDVIHMALRKAKVNVKETDVGFNYSRLIAGAIQAQWGFRTTAGITLPAQGVEINQIDLGEFVKTQGHVVITTEKVIREHPEQVQQFVSATLEGLQLSVDDPEAAVQAAVARDPNFLPSVGKKQMEIYRETILRNHPIGMLTLRDFEEARNEMSEVGLVPADLDVSKAVDDQFVKQHYRR